MSPMIEQFVAAPMAPQGTPLTPMQPAITPAPIQQVANFTVGADMPRPNLLINGGFEQWSNGPGPFTQAGQVCADSWVVTANRNGQVPSVSRVQPSNPPNGSLSALKITGNNNVGNLVTQTIDPSICPLNGVTVAFTCLVFAPVASQVQVIVGVLGDVGYQLPQPLDGNGTWQQILMTCTLPSNPATVSVALAGAGSADFIFDNATLVVGSAPANYQPGMGGPIGPAGSSQGPQGIQGVAGPVGATGPAGTPGALGQTGATGPQGVQGQPGATGSTGAQGPAGPVGPQGSTGTGILMKGSVATVAALPSTGNTQGDAYIVQADDSLRIWDGTKWVSGGSIQGPPGAAGPQGIQGATGNTGAQGLTGTTGAVGPTGPQGLTGATGATGPQGIQGATGLTGATGAQGIQGIQGIQGPSGVVQNVIKTAVDAQSSTSTTAVIIPNSSVTITTTGGTVLVFASLSASNNSNNRVNYLSLFADSVLVSNGASATIASGVGTLSAFWRLTPAAGSHTYALGWSSAAGTLATTTDTPRSLLVMEVKP